MRTSIAAAIAGLAVIAALGAPLVAQQKPQRDPAYAAARAQGRVGEKPDGYLAIVGEADPALQRMVDDINIKRKAVYTARAQKNKTTIENYAFFAGCTAILRTEPGEKYRAPDGSWQTRTAAEPLRDSQCPQPGAAPQGAEDASAE